MILMAVRAERVARRLTSDLLSYFDKLCFIPPMISILFISCTWILGTSVRQTIRLWDNTMINQRKVTCISKLLTEISKFTWIIVFRLIYTLKYLKDKVFKAAT